MITGNQRPRRCPWMLPRYLGHGTRTHVAAAPGDVVQPVGVSVVVVALTLTSTILFTILSRKSSPILEKSKAGADGCNVSGSVELVAALLCDPLLCRILGYVPRSLDLSGRHDVVLTAATEWRLNTRIAFWICSTAGTSTVVTSTIGYRGKFRLSAICGLIVTVSSPFCRPLCRDSITSPGIGFEIAATETARLVQTNRNNAMNTNYVNVRLMPGSAWN